MHNVFRGGYGFVSTVTDYLRFCQMLLYECIDRGVGSGVRVNDSIYCLRIKNENT